MSPIRSTAAVLAFPFRGEELAALRADLAGDAELQCYQCHAHLLRAVAASPPAAVLIGVRDREGAPTAPVIDELRSRYPRVPVVGYCELTYGDVRAVVAASGAGVEHFVIRGYDSARAVLHQILRQTGSDHRADVVLAEIGPFATGVLERTVRHCLTHPDVHPSVARVAAAMRISTATLTNAMRRERLPSPGHVISWCRLLAAADGLENPGQSVSRVATELGFASASELRMMLKRHTGLRPSELRARGGLRFLAGLFRERLAACAPSASHPIRRP